MKLGKLYEHINTPSSLEKPQCNASNPPCVLKPAGFLITWPHGSILPILLNLSHIFIICLPSAFKYTQHLPILAGQDAYYSALSSYSLFPTFLFLQNLLRYLISSPPPLSLFSGRHLALITRVTAATRADLTECSLCTSHNNPLRPVLLCCNFIDEMLTLRLSSLLHASCIDRAGIKPRSE